MLGALFFANMDTESVGWQSIQRHETQRTTPGLSDVKSIAAQVLRRFEVTSYQFSVILDASPQGEAEILDIADSLGNVDCLDASLCGHSEGVEAVFDREAPSLQDAIHSAVTAVEAAGYQIKRVELERQQIVAKM